MEATVKIHGCEVKFSDADGQWLPTYMLGIRTLEAAKSLVASEAERRRREEERS